jgi:hypothetical protein
MLAIPASQPPARKPSTTIKPAINNIQAKANMFAPNTKE